MTVMNGTAQMLLVILLGVGLLFFAGANLLEYLVVPWQRRRRTG